MARQQSDKSFSTTSYNSKEQVNIYKKCSKGSFKDHVWEGIVSFHTSGWPDKGTSYCKRNLESCIQDS